MFSHYERHTRDVSIKQNSNRITMGIEDIISTNIVVLNDEERRLVENSFKRLSGGNEAYVLEMSKKLMNLERISSAISRFPSIHETSVLAGEKRSQATLIDNLCKTPKDSRMLSMPTKAVLGRGFIVAKFHVFSALTKVAANSLFPEEELDALRSATLNIIFTIMAEDVYISILDSNILETSKREKAAQALTYLWEHRLDQTIITFAPVLNGVWSARDKIAPVFGTMMGTSELFLLSAKLDETWQRFMIEKLPDTVIGQALEEFLFGISHEDILSVRKELSKKGIPVMGRDEVSKLLNRDFDFSNTDPHLFYASYVERKNNAEARKRLNIEGPKNTLEDYYIGFLFENDMPIRESTD